MKGTRTDKLVPKKSREFVFCVAGLGKTAFRKPVFSSVELAKMYSTTSSERQPLTANSSPHRKPTTQISKPALSLFKAQSKPDSHPPQLKSPRPTKDSKVNPAKFITSPRGSKEITIP